MTENVQADAGFRVVVFADFVCPYSYLAVDQIDRLAREYDLKPLWRPHWLHPETPLEGAPREKTPEAQAKRERLKAWIQEMAPEQYPRIRFPEKRQYSFRAFEALELAYDCGLDLEFKTALYDLMWTQDADIAEQDTLVAAGERVGIEPAEMKAALEGGEYLERALDAVNGARRIGIMNTPTIFLGRTRINGWHYYEVLQSVLEQQGVRPKQTRASQPKETLASQQGEALAG
ncbi:MAG: thioredoxin domain-containing protein [Betaproteobacteria bacterium]|nr:thioredoxin domain-containing protein [Betaproteobacteria bacterium]